MAQSFRACAKFKVAKGTHLLSLLSELLSSTCFHGSSGWAVFKELWTVLESDGERPKLVGNDKSFGIKIKWKI